MSGDLEDLDDDPSRLDGAGQITISDTGLITIPAVSGTLSWQDAMQLAAELARAVYQAAHDRGVVDGSLLDGLAVPDLDDVSDERRAAAHEMLSGFRISRMAEHRRHHRQRIIPRLLGLDAPPPYVAPRLDELEPEGPAPTDPEIPPDVQPRAPGLPLSAVA